VPNYNLANPSLKINHLNDTTFQDSVFYISGLGGPIGQLRLDDVKKWAEKMPVAINKAELRLEFENAPVDSLISKILFFTDFNSKGLQFDQYYIAKSASSKYNKAKKYFSYNISLHLQDLISGRITNNKIYIEPENTGYSPSYAILRSGSHSKRMKLIVTYTKL
jgi:hypothetical protein